MGDSLPKAASLTRTTNTFWKWPTGNTWHILTDANPSKQGLDPLPWSPLDNRGNKGLKQSAKDVSPLIVLRIDLTALAQYPGR